MLSFASITNSRTSDGNSSKRIILATWLRALWTKAARLFNDRSQHALTMAEIIAELAIGLGFLDRIQILTLNVFDQRNFQRLFIGEIADNRLYLMQLRALRRTPTAFTRDNLIPLPMRTDQNGLD